MKTGCRIHIEKCWESPSPNKKIANCLHCHQFFFRLFTYHIGRTTKSHVFCCVCHSVHNERSPHPTTQWDRQASPFLWEESVIKETPRKDLSGPTSPHPPPPHNPTSTWPGTPHILLVDMPLNVNGILSCFEDISLVPSTGNPGSAPAARFV